MKLGIIGAGNMATAIVHGLLHESILNRDQIMISARSLTRLLHFQTTYDLSISTDNLTVIEFADIVLLAVKPAQFPTVITQIRERIIAENITVISIAAGLSLADLHALFGADVPIVRVMPNINATVFASTTALCPNQWVDDVTFAAVTSLFSALGKTYEIDESQMSTFIAIAGSAPAYAYLFVDALAQGALKHGMSKELALNIAAQTLLGSAQMVLESGKHPRVLMDQVSSPAGTTIAAISSLESNNFVATVIQAVDACIEKDKNLNAK
ncbi:MAG: pyrroline-5-carboxylate reductase [Culicoidibacterales bacterium]